MDKKEKGYIVDAISNLLGFRSEDAEWYPNICYTQFAERIESAKATMDYQSFLSALFAFGRESYQEYFVKERLVAYNSDEGKDFSFYSRRLEAFRKYKSLDATNFEKLVFLTGLQAECEERSIVKDFRWGN